MRSACWSIALLAAGVAGCVVPNGTARALDKETEAAIAAYNQCIFDYGSRACIGFVLDPRIQVFDRPSDEAKPVGNVKYRPPGGILLVDPASPPGTPDWIRVQTLALPDRAVLGWARRTQVAIMTDFRRVNGCWPVASINWHQPGGGDVADADMRLRFTMDGEVQAERGGRRMATNYAVYYARGVFRILDKSNEDNDDLDITGMLIPEQHQVTLKLGRGRSLKPPYTMVDRAKLADCKQIPLVDSNPLVLKKNSR
jgi:hypothetical protein